jgi:hypothetical protein
VFTMPWNQCSLWLEYAAVQAIPDPRICRTRRREHFSARVISRIPRPTASSRSISLYRSTVNVLRDIAPLPLVSSRSRTYRRAKNRPRAAAAGGSNPRKSPWVQSQETRWVLSRETGWVQWEEIVHLIKCSGDNTPISSDGLSMPGVWQWARLLRCFGSNRTRASPIA